MPNPVDPRAAETLVELPRSRVGAIARIIGMLGGVWGVGITLALLFLPVIQVCERAFSLVLGQEFSGCFSKTLIQWQGGSLEPLSWVYLASMAGLLLVALVLRWRNRAPRARVLPLLALGILLASGTFIAGFSIGLFYLPSALLVLLAAILSFAA